MNSLNSAEIKKYVAKIPLPIYVFDKIDSTNNFAKTLSDDFALVVADSQTGGRGRLGREFFSPRGTGVYMSCKVNIPSLYENVPFITTLAAVAVHKAIAKLYNIDCSIKWVNDIYIGNKKVSGILCEACDERCAVIGIGINFSEAPLPENLKSIATHLPQNPSVTRAMLIGEVTNNLCTLISHLPDTSFMDYYKSHSCVIGKNVLCTRGNESFSGLCTGISPQGALIVKTECGTLTLSSGEITLRFTD